MGLFDKLGSVCKSVGRKVGKAVETVGEWTGSETLQYIGEGIQSACEEVSYDTGEVDTYDKESARAEETRRINKILTDFSLKLEKKADEIEQTSIKKSNIYFKKLINELDSSELEVDINVAKIKKSMNKVEKEIQGNLKQYISKRVSIDDDECLEILKMEAGYLKEKEMKKFSKKILQLGLKNLVKDIKGVIKEQGIIIADTIEERLEEMKYNLSKQLEQLKLLEESKLQDEEKLNNLKDQLNTKIQLSEVCIDLLN